MAKRRLPFELNAALFTINDVVEISGIGRATLDMYLHRGIFEPAERQHARPMFSVIEAFKAKLIRELIENIGLGPSESSALANAATGAKSASAQSRWMAAVAESIEAENPLEISSSAMRLNNKWKIQLETDRVSESRTLHLHLPLDALFAEVYCGCKTLLSEKG